jgi:hypothetical protein
MAGLVGWALLWRNSSQAAVLEKSPAAATAPALDDNERRLRTLADVLQALEHNAAPNMGASVDGRRVYLAVERLAGQTADLRVTVVLAWMLWRGWGTTANEKAAWDALRPALDHRWPRALYLAWWFQREVTTPLGGQAGTLPITLLREAAFAGDALALNAMGVHTALQEPGRAPSAAVLAWFTRAQQAGSMAARHNLQSAQAMLDKTGDDARTAVTALTQRAQQRDPAAMFLLAQRYHRGQGVPQDLGEALRLYGVASYLGHAPARRMMDLWARELKLQPGRATPADMLTHMQADAAALKRLAQIDVTAPGWKVIAPLAGLWVYDDDPLRDLERLPV